MDISQEREGFYEVAAGPQPEEEQDESSTLELQKSLNVIDPYYLGPIEVDPNKLHSHLRTLPPVLFASIIYMDRVQVHIDTAGQVFAAKDLLLFMELVILC